MRHFIPGVALVALAMASPAAAQSVTIDPGMTRAEVVQLLGKPVGERTSGSYNYLFYPNNCEVRCGMQDLVILQNDLVVDAIFRSSRRVYSGTSSSPEALTPSKSNNSAGRTGAIRTTDESETPAPRASSPAKPTDTPTPSRTPTTSGTTTPTRTGSSTTAPAPSGSTTSSPSRGGVVTGVSTQTPTETPTTSGVVGGASVTSRPATPATTPNRGTAPAQRDNPMTGVVGNKGMDSTKALDNVPLNPHDTTTTTLPSRTQGQLTPSAPNSQPVPYGGSKPNPRDSAVKAKTGQKPDTVKPPEE